MNKYFTTEEVNNFKNLFRDLINELDLKNNGVYSEEEREMVLLKIVSEVFNISVKNNKPDLSETELKQIQGSLLIMMYECLEENN